MCTTQIKRLCSLKPGDFTPVTLTLYTTLVSEFVMRFNMDEPVRHSEPGRGRLTRHLKLQLIGLGLITFFVLVRCAFLSLVVVCSLTNCTQCHIQGHRAHRWLEWRYHLHSMVFQCVTYILDLSLVDNNVCTLQTHGMVA